MIKISQQVELEVHPREIGLRIATVGNDDQAAFFDGLAEGFQDFSEDDRDGYQMLSIKDVLSQRAKDFIKKFAEYIEM